MNEASSSKKAQNHAALVRASVGEAAAFVETQAIALRDRVAKPTIAKVRSNAPVVRDAVVLHARCGAAYAVSFLRTLVGK